MARCALLAFLPLCAARSVVLAFLGHSDSSYEGLLEELRSEGKSRDLQILWPEGHFKSFQDMQRALKELLQQHPDADLVYMGHGMEGGAAAQAEAVASEAQGLVLLAGFLERRWRPDIEACGKTWAKQPSVVCPKLFCPGGYLKDGVHSCKGGGPVVYPLPSLSIGGELDGVVRVARLAEAWYTQRNTSHLVRVVPGMSHADLLSQAPPELLAKDLPSTCGPKKARLQVAQLVVDFLTFQVVRSFEENFFRPWKEMFLLEGSWWWTGNSDESGSSDWAAKAQQRLVDPLPGGFTWGKAQDDFHLLSDEELIPPYYRSRHRPNLTLETSTVSSRTVTQLRYVELSVLEVAGGLNGWAVIKEEKAARAAKEKDDGSKPVAAIEIATKMCSRQKAFELCGAAASPELDQGDRCKAINEEAYDLALKSASKDALKRFQERGRPLVMMPDKKPVPPAGPWWIWGYLSFADMGSAVQVTAPYAFYPLNGPAYGAGNHYCKLLSPAMALEWIYIDSLRPSNASLQALLF